MFWEEQCYVLHELLPYLIIVPSHLQGTEHIVQETLVHVHGDQLEEVLVQQGEHLVPHVLLDLHGLPHIMTLFLVEVIETGCCVDCSCSQAEMCQALWLQLWSGGGQAAF